MLVFYALVFAVAMILFPFRISNGDASFHPRRFGLLPKHEINSLRELLRTAENHMKNQRALQKLIAMEEKQETRRRKIFKDYLGAGATGSSFLNDFHTNQIL